MRGAALPAPPANLPLCALSAARPHPWNTMDEPVRLERLERQLGEVEVLQSMYPEEEFEVSETSLAAAAAAVAAADAVAASELSPVSFSITVALEGVGDSPSGPTLRLGVTLPQEYPCAAPALVIGCALLQRKQREALQQQLLETARTRTEGLGEDGEECIYDLLQEAVELATPLVVEAHTAAGAAADGENAAQQVAVVRIDHMNASKQYMAKLRKWAEQLGLAGRVFFHPTEKKSGERVEGVCVVLVGAVDSVSGWLSRLRSEYIDVDSKGNKCKERKSTTLSQREVGGLAAVAGLEGWETVPYEETGELETALAELDLLHVGAGATRWGGGGDSSEPEPESEQQAGSHDTAMVDSAQYLRTVGAGSIASTVLLDCRVNVRKQRSVLTTTEAELRSGRPERLEFDLAAQPREGAANTELCRLVAVLLAPVAKAAVTLGGGGKARDKTVAIEGLSERVITERLVAAAAVGGGG